MINGKVQTCYIYNSGSSKYGIETEIKYIYQELTNLYFDFIQSNNKFSDSYHFLTGEDLVRSFLDFDYVFEYTFKTYSYSVMQDIGKLYERTDLYENILCISLLVILVFVVIYVFFWNDRGNNKYKTLLKFITKLY